jgi:hypothetical protein
MRRIRRLREAGFTERLHPRGRGGKFEDVLGKLEHEPTGPRLLALPKPEQVKREAAAPKSLLPGDKPTMFESHVCSKCGGEGKIWTYSNVMGGTCFKCGGRGRTLTPRGQKAQAHYRDLLSTRADELKPGNKIWDSGVPGFTSSGWKTVQSVTPNSDGTFNVKAEGGGLTNAPAGKKWRTLHTAEEKKVAADAAKAFQATLPGPKPKKPKPKASPKPKKPPAPKPPTAKQMDLVKKLATEHGHDVPESMSRAEASQFIDTHLALPKPGAAPKADVIEGEATNVKGKLISARYKEGPYGAQPKALIEDERGFRVYGTLPAKLGDELSKRAAATGDPNWENYLKAHPTGIHLTGATKKSQKDSAFGFYSKPKNAGFHEIQEAAMPYSLRGTTVIREDTGQVVKKHPDEARALAHLRALKANVESQEAVWRALDEHAQEWLPTEEQLALHESVQTAALSSTPSPFSTSTTSNWIARVGGLPAYIQNVAKGIIKSGKTESQAIQMAIGVMKNWASGRGKVSPEVRAAAAKALAQWEAKKAASHAKTAAKAAVAAAKS